MISSFEVVEASSYQYLSTLRTIIKVNIFSSNIFSSSINSHKDLILLNLSEFKAREVRKSRVVCQDYLLEPMMSFQLFELISSSETCILEDKLIEILKLKQ